MNTQNNIQSKLKRERHGKQLRYVIRDNKGRFVSWTKAKRMTRQDAIQLFDKQTKTFTKNITHREILGISSEDTNKLIEQVVTRKRLFKKDQTQIGIIVKAYKQTVTADQKLLRNKLTGEHTFKGFSGKGGLVEDAKQHVFAQLFEQGLIKYSDIVQLVIISKFFVAYRSIKK